MSNNVEGVYKRGVTLGLVIGWGNLNGVVSSNIYRAQDKPTYRPGHATVMGYMILFLLGGSILQELLLRAENAKRRAGKRDVWIEGKTEAEIAALGDKRCVSVLSIGCCSLTKLGLISCILCETPGTGSDVLGLRVGKITICGLVDNRRKQGKINLSSCHRIQSVSMWFGTIMPARLWSRYKYTLKISNTI